MPAQDGLGAPLLHPSEAESQISPQGEMEKETEGTEARMVEGEAGVRAYNEADGRGGKRGEEGKLREYSERWIMVAIFALSSLVNGMYVLRVLRYDV